MAWISASISLLVVGVVICTVSVFSISATAGLLFIAVVVSVSTRNVVAAHVAARCSRARSFFAAFFQMSSIVRIHEKRERQDARHETRESDTKTGCKMTENRSTQDCVSRITLSSPRWDSAGDLTSGSLGSRQARSWF